MSKKPYEWQIVVIPEDDANRDLANGFILGMNAAGVITVGDVAGGRDKTLEVAEYRLESHTQRRLIIVMDFDNHVEKRRQLIDKKITGPIRDRIYVLGVKTNPEAFRAALAGGAMGGDKEQTPMKGRHSLEAIGKRLAHDLLEGADGQWCALEELKHNGGEWARFKREVLPTLREKINRLNGGNC